MPYFDTTLNLAKNNYTCRTLCTPSLPCFIKIHQTDFEKRLTKKRQKFTWTGDSQKCFCSGELE